MAVLNGRSVTTQGTRLVDLEGRIIFLNGINLVYKGERRPDGSYNFYADWDEEVYRRLAGMGFNVLRFGVLWAAMEPAPGQYDAQYFDYVRREMDKAHESGLSVILDMHQDLYAQRYADGAPDWAALSDQPFEATELWSDAYLFSGFVQECWDQFWGNARPAGSRKGLLDHYADLWTHIARSFQAHPALLGYDLLNEPAPGSEIQEMFALVLQSLAGMMTGEEATALGLREPSMDALVEVFSTPEKKMKALDLLNDPERYRALGEACCGPVMRFEREKLAPFYEKMAAAIRAVDQHSYILRGNNYMSNIGIPSGIQPILVDGKPDPRQIFAPHGYDLTVDTPAIDISSDSRAGSIFARYLETQRQNGLPTLVGEWGAFGQSPAALTHGQFLIDLFDSNGWGNTYWCYEEGIFDFPAARLLRRSHPVALFGQVLSQTTDRQAGTYEIAWREDSAPEDGVNEFYVHLQPAGAFLDGQPLPPDAVQGGRLFIKPLGRERRLVLRFR